MRPQLGILALCLFILLLANLFPRILPMDLEQRAQSLADFGLQSQAGEAYEQLSRLHPESVGWRMALVDAFHLSAEQVHQRYAEQLYELKSRDVLLFSLGYASLTVDQRPDKALAFFDKVHDRKLAGLHYYSGLVWQLQGQGERARECWQEELRVGGLTTKAVRMLGYAYVKTRDLQQVRALVDDPLSGPLTTPALRRWLALHEGRWLQYSLDSWQAPFSRPAPAVAAAFLIALMWMVLFRRIDLFEPEPVWAILAMFALGSCSCLWLTMPLSDWINALDPRLPISIGPELINTDVLYAIGHVGIQEELVKIVPVLFFALVSRQFNEPLDWMIYGSLSALAFSTFENIDYFGTAPAAGMLPRFTLCVLGHMLYTGIICYAWTRSRHMQGRSRWSSALITLAAFAVAATLHGLYDFVPGEQKLLVGWLEALLYGRLLANALSHSPFYPERPSRLERLRNEDLIECTGLLLLLIPYLWCNFSTSTELANQWLAGNAWNYLLLLTYFSTVGFLTLARQRELWFGQPDEDQRHSSSQRSLQILRSVLVLVGLDYILSRAMGGFTEVLHVFFATLVLGLFWVYFRGAFGGLRSPLQWMSRRPSLPQLTAAGFLAVEAPQQTGRIRALLELTAGPALLAAVLLAGATLLSEGQKALDLALPFIVLSAPLAWVRPQFASAWRHSSLPIWAWVFHNGRIVLWSRLPAGQLVTAAWISPWRVRPRRLQLQLLPGARFEELLERHAQVPDLQALRSLEEDLGDYVSSIQAAFLASPLRSTLRAAWQTLTRQRAYIRR